MENRKSWKWKASIQLTLQALYDINWYDSFQDWKEIGRGGFGTIYRAFSEDAEKIVALKTIHHDSSSVNVNEFIKEISLIVISGKREAPFNGTPIDFLNLYTNAWNGDPNLRPSIAEIRHKLNNIKINPIYYDENIVLNEQEQERDIVSNMQDISNERYMISSGKDMILSSVGNSNYTETGTSVQSTVSSFTKHRPPPESWIQQPTEDGNEFTSGNEQEHSTRSINIRRPDIKVVVALEIGTTYSGFAYSNKINPETITNDTAGVFKTNTVLAYDDKLQLVAWGYPALAQTPPKKKKALARPQPKPVELFMLHLSNLKEEDKPPLPPGLDAKRVITDYLHEMNKSRWPGIRYPQQVRFVLPVPAEWLAIHSIINWVDVSVYKAIENLEFITNPVATTIYCMKTLNEHHLSVESSFLIVDCGEETVDVTTRTLLPGMKFSEITERSGDLCGSSYVDREFLKFLGRKLGFAAMKKLKENFYEQMRYLVQEFCLRVKFSFNGNPNEYSPKELDIERCN
ncbi:21172_t:CDS:10, partial [Cetraspora pellucida]